MQQFCLALWRGLCEEGRFESCWDTAWALGLLDVQEVVGFSRDEGVLTKANVLLRIESDDCEPSPQFA